MEGTSKTSPWNSKISAGHQAPHDGDLLVHALAAALPGDAADGVVLGPRARADPEHQAVAGQHGGRTDLLGDEHGLADGELDHEGDEANALGHRPHGGDQRERLEEGLVLEELPGPVGIERVGGVGHLGVADAVGHDDGVVSSFLGRPRQGEVVRRVGHRLRIRESQLQLPCPLFPCRTSVRCTERRLPCGPCPFILPGPAHRGTTPRPTASGCRARRPWSRISPSTTWSATPAMPSGRWPTPTTRAGPTTSACWRATWPPGATGSSIPTCWRASPTCRRPPRSSGLRWRRRSPSRPRRSRVWPIPKARWPPPGVPPGPAR